MRLANFGGKDRLDWRPVVTSTRNLPKLVDGLDRPLKSDDEETDLVTVATNVNSMLGPSGLTIVISDWWTREPDIAAKAFGRSGRELVAIQLLAPEEEDPRLLVEGWARLTDAESGDMLDLSLEAEAHAAYLDELGSWREKLGTGIEEVGGRLFTMRTDRDVSEVLHGDLQRAGLLG
ncbi:MAG TPA: hypothetical protein VF168_15000 [Trueperaceae bacterium]